MIIIGLLVWIGVQLEAPASFYILLGLNAMIKLIAFGTKLGEKK